MSNDSDDSITKGIEIKRPGNRGKEQERGVLDAARERKNRSIFGYHMSQVVHQDNMDRIATETAAKLVSSGFNNVLLNQQQQQQQQQQGISNSDLATFLRGLGDYMTATASTIVKVAGASSSTAASGGTAESDRVQTPSSLPLQPPPLPLQPPLLQPRGGMAVPADDRASARQTTGTRSAAIPGHRSRNKNNNKASLSTGQSSAMDVDHATDLGKRQQVSGYSGRRAEPSEALDFELDVSDIE
ncbi:hypothetical protein LPJ56_006221 [Coemansia sp. RSA 2599]|nr:hypothetical protein LPJ56_006221 [Coemansia sp. RSA 2599]